ncbi:MAG TPA: invasin domain 3-containing protein [Gemmatimonadota bacterium]|nr:invasin domain 3-containing protein [Gemmatimonadota bacterium]
MDCALSLRFSTRRLHFLLAIGTLAVVAGAETARAQSLHVVLEPAGPVDVGETFSVHVEVRDAGGVPDGSFSPNVVLTLIGGGSLSGNAALKVDADGIARFDDLAISPAGSYRLAASGGPAVPDTTGTIVVESTATAIALDFEQQPTSTSAGSVIAPPVTVRAVDGGGATDVTFTENVTIAIGSNPGGGTLSGTTTVAAVNGVATFDDLWINRAASGYTLAASASGLSGATSNAFAITPGLASAANSNITADPTSIPGDGASTSTITVELLDSFGNPLTTSGGTVALSTTAGSLGPVTDQSDGTYTAILTAPSNDTTATITGTVNGANIADNATVTFTAVATRVVFGQQPTNAVAGATISPPVTVRAVDNSGTLVTSFNGNVTIALATNPGGGTLSGTTTVQAINGVATFSNLSINRTGSGYTLQASASGLAGATSNTFDITPGPASGATSQITASPTSIPADGTSTSTITVEVRDAQGNVLTAGGDVVALSTSSGSIGAASFQGNGLYTATLTSSTVSGNATVSGTVNGSVITDTATVTFTQVPTRVVFGQQPTTAVAGATISPPVTVRAVDNAGTTVTSFTGNITIAIGTNPGGGTLSGTTTVAAVGGVATFGNLSINRTGAGYTLTAGAAGLTGATSAAFSITAGPASGATTQITASPTSILANGTSTSTITVEVRDAQGNVRTAGGDVVALSTTAGSLGAVSFQGNGIYTATLTAPSAPANATVSGTVNGATITDTAAVTFTLVAPVATRLEFGQQPTNTQAGATIAPPVTVRVVDTAGTTVTSFTGNVTIAIGANPGGGTLSGTTTVAAVAGVATFGNLSIQRSGDGYTLTASASGLTGATSASFNISPGSPSGATSLITAAPISVPADGSSTSTITVELRDAFGNRRVSGGPDVDLFTTAGSMGPVSDLGDGTYTASLTAPTTAAVATVTGTVNGAPITDTATVTFTTVPSNPNRLEFLQQPTTTVAGASIAPPVQLRVVDLSGATVTSFTGSVTIAIAVNPGGGTLSGTTTVVAVAGVATFPNLSIDRTGVGYRLSAGASGITGATSDQFSILTGAPSTATTQITAAPVSIAADGSSTSTITVEVRDALGNRRTTGGDPVALSTTAGSLGPVTDLGNGTYVATLVSATTAGSATIRGTLGGAQIADTATVAFTGGGPPAATRLIFGQQPSNAQIGSAISPPVTIRAVDAGGATVPSFTGTVTIAIGTNPGGGTLSGTTTVSAVAGVATFSDLSLNAAGNGYTLAASATGLTGATSNPFAILAAPPPTSTDLAITASADDATPAVGDTVRYTIRVTNQGSIPATGVAVDYELSTRLAFVSSVPTQGTYDPQLEVWSVGTIEPSEGATLVIVARVLR